MDKLVEDLVDNIAFSFTLLPDDNMEVRLHVDKRCLRQAIEKFVNAILTDNQETNNE